MREIQRIGRLRRIFTESSKGRGLASSLVDTFRFSKDKSEKEVARLILLGIPPTQALRLLLESGERGARGLVNYIVAEGRVNARNAGRRAEKLAIMFERWARLKETRILEQKVMELRGHIISAILGAVLAFLASLAPFVASFQLFAVPSPLGSGLVVYSGCAMTIVSSAFLGSFLSPRRRYVDPIIAVIAFLVALQMTAPIANVPAPNLGGIK